MAIFSTACFLQGVSFTISMKYAKHLFLVGFSSSRVELQASDKLHSGSTSAGPTVSSHLSSWHCNISHYSTATGPELLPIPVDTSKTDFLVI